MATFVLVHGAWHGGWCFDGIAQVLQAQGHHVIAPDLPGMGADDEGLAAITLDGWAGFIADLCRTAPQRPVILAGHSRGGVVISQAAEIAPEAIDALVYICAMMLPDGMSRASFRESEPTNPAYEQLTSLTSGGQGSVVVSVGAAEVFAQLSPPQIAADAMRRLVAEPETLRTAIVRLTSDRWGSVPRTYIECTQDRVIPLASQRRMQALSPGTRVMTLDADHSPFLSRPTELSAVLSAVAEGAYRTRGIAPCSGSIRV